MDTLWYNTIIENAGLQNFMLVFLFGKGFARICIINSSFSFSKLKTNFCLNILGVSVNNYHFF